MFRLSSLRFFVSPVDDYLLECLGKFRKTLFKDDPRNNGNHCAASDLANF